MFYVNTPSQPALRSIEAEQLQRPMREGYWESRQPTNGANESPMEARGNHWKDLLDITGIAHKTFSISIHAKLVAVASQEWADATLAGAVKQYILDLLLLWI